MARSRRLTHLAAPVLDAAREVDRSAPLVVATSGGADSAVALWACAQQTDVRALHIDHGWAASRNLRAAAERVAGAVGVPIQVVEVDADRSEAGARAARYAAFTDVEPAATVVTAHTADDLAETVLANLARGAGLDGQLGIPARRSGFVRPFLELRRGHLRELAALLGLPWVDDPANVDPVYTRVRLRSMLAGWETAMSRPIVATLARNAAVAAAEVGYLEERSADLVVKTDGRLVGLDLAPVQTAPTALARRAVRRALRAIGDAYAGTAADVEAAMAVVAGGPPCMVAGTTLVRRRAGRLEFVGSAVDPVKPPPAVTVTVPGQAHFGSWTVSFDVADALPVTLRAGRRVEVFDVDVVGERLSVEAVGAGHQLVMTGGGHKGAVDALAERGIDDEDRPGWPVVLGSDARPLWIPGVRRAALGWVTSHTRRYLVATAAQEERWTPVEY